MTISPRRALPTILAAALLLGAAPSRAQVARVATGETGGMPVSPVAGRDAGSTFTPAASLSAAGLAGALAAPAPAPSAVPAQDFSVIAARKTAAAAPVFTAPSALTAAVKSAASEEAPKLPETPKEAAKPVAKKTWRQRLAAAFGRKPAPEPVPVPEAPTSEAAKEAADQAFDGAAKNEAKTEGPVVDAAAGAVHSSGLQASSKPAPQPAPAKRSPHVDQFGGPLSEPMTFKGRVAYGFKQGLHLIGISAILGVTLRPFLALFPWPQYLSDSALHGFGRVALLTQYGPNEIVEAVAHSPLGFLGVGLPWAVTMEELKYRLFSFGLTFLLLAAIRPFTRWIASMIDGLPDAAGVVGAAKRALKAGDVVSRFAFPIAAILSSYKFAIAHLATWGFSPFVLALNFSIGLFLAYTAYKSRSLTSPILAHLTFNVVTVGAMVLALYTSPLAAAAFAIVAGLVGVATLLHSWLTTRKERAFRLKHGAAAALVALMIAGSVGAPGVVRSGFESAVQQVQHKTETAPAPLLSAPLVVDTTKVAAPSAESRADMVARVKPAIVNVIVYMPGGYAIGSGFILSPEGVFVTNGHVVGAKQPGEYVNAKVPGVDKLLKAKVLAVNHDKDLAIVQLEPRPDGKPWPTVALAKDAPREGEDVTAIGYPRGLPFTVTRGVVSGLDGRGNMYVRMLQTDAAINPGNSGGPLFNDKGEVIGVNTEIRTESGGSEGLGFSIQAPEVKRALEQFAKTGNIATASLGIIVNLSDPQAPDAGLEIEYVRYGSAAEKAGLRRGDLVIGVGDETIDEGGGDAAEHVAAVLSKSAPGEKVKVTVLRGDEPTEFELTVDAKATAAPRD